MRAGDHGGQQTDDAYVGLIVAAGHGIQSRIVPSTSAPVYTQQVRLGVAARRHVVERFPHAWPGNLPQAALIVHDQEAWCHDVLCTGTVKRLTITRQGRRRPHMGIACEPCAYACMSRMLAGVAL